MSKISQYNRRWLATVAIIAVPILVLLIVGQFTPVLTDWLFKQAIDRTSFSAPPDFQSIQGNVVVKKDMPYNAQGTLLDIYHPRNGEAPLPLIIWIHGGGFIGASKEQTQTHGMTLANAGYVVANINYSLAPAHKYPTPILEANQALKYLQDNAGQYRVDASRIFLGSNSSGSQISSELAALISNAQFARELDFQPAVQREQLKGMLLYDGAYDMRTVTATGAFGMGQFLWSYTGERDFESYNRLDELSTVLHVTPDYPPVFLAVGDADPLQPQSKEMLEVLQENGVEVEADLHTGTNNQLGHDYMLDLATAPAQETLKKALDFLQRHSRP